MKRKNIFGNYLYLLRLIQKASPMRITLSVVTEVISNFFRIFYSVLFFSYFMQRVSESAEYKEILMLLGFVAILNILFEVLLSLYKNVYVVRSDVKLSVYIRTMVYRKILTVDMSCFDDTQYYDEITFTTVNIYNRSLRILNTISSFLAHLVCAGVLISFFSNVNVWVIIIALLSLAVGLFTGPIKNRINFKYINQSIPNDRRLDYLNRILVQNDYCTELRVTNIRNVLQNSLQQAFQGYKRLLGVFETKITGIETVGVLLGYGVVSFIITLISNHKMVIAGTMSVAIFLPLLSAVAEFTWRASSIITLFNQLLEHNLYLQKIRTFMDHEPTVISLENHTPTAMQTLRFKDVGFRYTEQGEQILRHINLEVKAGQKIAIVGYNGAGKSTLVNLLLRLYDPTEGTIEYNGENIRTLDPEKYRRKFGVLFQDIHLYATTIKKNILMDTTEQYDPSQKELDVLAEKFNMRQKIHSMEHLYETEMTHEFQETGELLSGGQTQSLALMRLYYNRQADVYILDEPTSALDPIAEAQIFENIRKNSEGKTVFFISHRFASSKAADHILFLENGEIVEEGTHDELMALDGAYAQMFRMQAQYYQTEEQI